jgi:two-component system chemotaxis sensor kinase CheA
MAALDIRRVRMLFVQEAEVRLAQLGELLLQLEQAPADQTLVRSVFRELHTLKGSAAVVGLTAVSLLAHELEEVVEELRVERTAVTPEVIDTLLAGTDRLAAAISGPPADTLLDDPVVPVGTDQVPGPAMRPPAPRHAAAALVPVAGTGVVLRPDDAGPPVSGPPVADLPAAGHPAAGSLVGHAGPTAIAPPRPAIEPGPAHVAPVWSPADTPRTGGVVMVPMDRLDDLVRLIGESTTAHLRVGRMLSERFGIDPASAAEFTELSRSLNDLQDRAMRTRMVPVATITGVLQRAVRDLSRAQGKIIRWDARGVDTELDRGVLGRLSDSLLHLVRNAVDHGIETPARRETAGKPAAGTIRLHAMQLGSEVIIAVTDDGAGVDADQVRQQAARQGIDTAALSEEAVLQLAFRAGLSTSAFVTDVSGRGVGLDVVRSNVEAARGRVEIRSVPGEGTEFRIVVPITLAVVRCLLVEAGGQRFALPFHRVVLCQAYRGAAQGSAEGRPVVWVDDEPVPFSSLAETLGRPRSGAGGPTVVLSDSARRHGFGVDRLLEQRDVVLKSLSRGLPHLPAVAGASVEPDGSILLVLDPPGLIQRARRTGIADDRRPPIHPPDRPRRRILVVDDALTVRELQRSILERAGFEVRVAADGGEALAKLAEEPSDLVLTDVEMPIMDGFALTEAIRAHPSVANIPVLILTSRASEADRQRGLDVGADGYIIKSGFDEGSLLTAVNRLLGART